MRFYRDIGFSSHPDKCRTLNLYDGRLLAVPFWIVERVREIEEGGSYQQRALSTIQKGTAGSLLRW